MEWIYYLILFVFGIVLGSFYNVVGLRVPEGNFLSSNRSFCPRCKKRCIGMSSYQFYPIWFNEENVKVVTDRSKKSILSSNF
nr:prepilin peptidase [Gracilibacillus boraciitolerans]